jgi:hypothetical protein
VLNEPLLDLTNVVSQSQQDEVDGIAQTIEVVCLPGTFVRGRFDAVCSEETYRVTGSERTTSRMIRSASAFFGGGKNSLS